ncbi:MAG TPA: efflux RND transporter periplasmic adaptor subunit [Caulobacteraceae bacterium]|nr:efflux RND transporter periplasmic adaptor subunit [Caulobacteraceae bacterium]
MRVANLTLACLLGGAGLAGCAGHARTPAPAKSLPVTTAKVLAGEAPIEQVGLGQVQAFNTAVARAEVSGQIVKVEFTEGQTVRAGSPIAQIDPRPLEATVAQDEANSAKDQAALSDAQILLDRDTPLAAKGLVSAQQLDTQRSLVAQLRGTVAADAAMTRRDKLQLDFASVRSPITGVTGLRLIDVGNLVGPTDPQGLVTITQIQPISVVFTLPQTDVPQIRQAMATAGPNGLEVDIYAQGGTATTPLDEGRLTVLSNQVDLASGTITLKAEFPNAAKILWPGESIDAHLVLARTPNALTVPSSAIQRDDKGAFVWAVGPGATVSAIRVQMGGQIADRAIVQSGLSAGQEVVTDGQFGLTPGARITRTKVGASAAQDLKHPAAESLGLTP